MDKHMSDKEKDKECEKVYKEFWKPIVEKKGRIDKKQLMRELWDWHYQMEQIPIIESEITGGLLSKIGYSAEQVLGVYREKLEENYLYKDSVVSDVTDILKDKAMNNKDKLKEIQEYLEIDLEG